MPRDGLQQYSPPPGTEGIPNYTVESARYNAFVADITQDLNLPRPISSGGTGASNAPDAMNNLGGELARQLITNYNADPFQAGSFYSAALATGAPNGNAFTGICYVSGVTPALNDMFIEARDQVTSTLYVRQKKAGVWLGWSVPAGVAAGPSPPPSVLPNSLWWDSTRGKLFIYYQDVDTSQWVEAVAVPDIDANSFVEISGDTMTGLLTLSGDAVNPLHAVAKRQLDAVSIAAAPLDAMSYNGMQINGSMEVSQERGTTPTTANSTFVCDGWRLQFGGAMTINAGIASGLFPSFSSYAYVANSNAPALGSSDFVILRQSIEGYRISRLAWGTSSAQPITIGFWSANTPAGVYSGVVRNEVINRNYAFNYTQNVANTPEYKTVTIAPETTGGWSTGNTIGLDLIFAFAVGSTLTAPTANLWSVGNYLAAPGQINGIAVASNALRITGVVVLPGVEAPSAARSPLIMRPYDQELVTCKRYWAKVFTHCRFFATGAGQLGTSIIPWPVEMRSGPTTALLTGGNFANQAGTIGASVTPTGMRMEVTSAAAGDCFALNVPWTADARL